MNTKSLLSFAVSLMISAVGFAQDTGKSSEAELTAGDQAIVLYPEVNIEGTALNKAVLAKAAELRKSNPAYFDNPKWPLLLIPEVAASLGITPVATQPAQPARRKAPTVLHQRYADDRVEDAYRDSAAELENAGKPVTNATILDAMQSRLEEIRREDATSGQIFLLEQAIQQLQARMRR